MREISTSECVFKGKNVNIHPIAWINYLVMEQSLRSNTTLRFEAQVESKAFVSPMVSFSAVSKLDGV